MFKIRIIVSTTLTATDFQKAAAWFILLAATALFWIGLVKLLF